MKTINLFTALVLVAGLAPVVGPVPVAQATAIAVNTTEPNISDDSFCSLIEAIINANDDTQTHDDCPAGSGADIIVLADGETYTLTVVDNDTDGPNGLPSITSEITIEGHGATIERSSTNDTPDFRIFHVTAGGDLTLNGLTIRQGQVWGYYGGGIYNDTDGTVELTGSAVKDNRALIGGGIFDRGTVMLIKSTVSDNESNGIGGGIYSLGSTVSLANSTFSGNSAGSAGGGIHSSTSSTVELTDSTVSDNSAVNGGGGISNDGTMRLTSSVVCDNNTGDDGGGIDNYGGTLELTNSLVSGNRADLTGGGIRNKGGTVELTDSTVSGNSAVIKGGGIYTQDGSVTLANSTVRDNEANGLENLEGGGGIFNESGLVELINSTVSGNRAVIEGSGIFNNEGALKLTNSTISDNSGAKDGGGIFNNSGTVVFTNSTVSGNSVGTEGGGIFNFFGKVELINSTISGNSASEGGGIRNGGLGTVELTNTIVAVNLAGGDCFGAQIISNGHNLDSDDTCNLNATGDLSKKDPRLGPLQDNGGPTETHALLSGSPAINSGDDNVCPPTDQRGVSRPQGSHCDIGAYEREKPTAIDLASFSAQAGDDGVTLAWETATELDNAGFNLYRALLQDGPYTQVNNALISAQGDPVSGGSYSLLDTPDYGTYYYKLEDVDYYGVSTLHGPVKATVARPLCRPLYRPTPPNF